MGRLFFHNSLIIHGIIHQAAFGYFDLYFLTPVKTLSGYINSVSFIRLSVSQSIIF